MNYLPEKLMALRKHFRYAQGDVAKKLNVPVTEYMKWENGNAVCSVEVLTKLAEIYKVPTDDLFNNTKSVVLPDPDEVFESVQIPFMSEEGLQEAEAVGDFETGDVELMPVEGVIEETYQTPKQELSEQTQEYHADELGSTREMDTKDFEPTAMSQIVDDEPKKKPKKEEPKPEADKKKIAMIAGCVLLALLLVFGGMKLFGGKGSKEINKLTNINRLTLGDKFALYINDQGKVVSTGSAPDISKFDNVVQVSAGEGFALGLKKDGTVVASNSSAVKDWKNVTMIAAGSSHSVGVTSDGKVLCTGNDSACKVEDWSNVKEVYAGDGITLAVTKEGTIKTSGTLACEGILSGLTNVQSLSVSKTMVAVVTKDGRVSCYSLSGNAVDAGSLSNISEAAVGNSYAAGLSSGRVTVISNDEAFAKKTANWSNIRYIAGRGETLIAVGNDQQIIGIGNNTYNLFTEIAEPEPTATPEPEQKLAQVQNVKFTTSVGNLSVKWDMVSDAGSYEIRVNTSPETILKSAKNSTSIPTNKLTSGTEYTFTFTSLSSDPDKYLDSDPLTVVYTYEDAITKLDQPTNVVYESSDSGFTIAWTSVANAKSYEVSMGAIKQVVTGTTLTIDGNNLKDGEKYDITLQALPEEGSKKYSASDINTISQVTYQAKSYTVTINCIDSATNTNVKTVVANVKSGDYQVSKLLEGQMPDGYSLAGDKTISVSANYMVDVNVSKPTPTPEPTPTPSPEPSASPDGEQG